MVTALPRWCRKSMILTLAFFAMAFALLLTAWAMRRDFAPGGWSNNDWYAWLFAFSPWGVSIQFGIGVAAYRLSSPAYSERFAKTASNLMPRAS